MYERKGGFYPVKIKDQLQKEKIILKPTGELKAGLNDARVKKMQSESEQTPTHRPSRKSCALPWSSVHGPAWPSVLTAVPQHTRHCNFDVHSHCTIKLRFCGWWIRVATMQLTLASIQFFLFPSAIIVTSASELTRHWHIVYLCYSRRSSTLNQQTARINAYLIIHKLNTLWWVLCQSFVWMPSPN